MDFRRTTLAELAADVAARRVSSRELVQAALDRIEEVDQRVNAFTVVDAERALDDAAEIDERVASGEDVGALVGIPIGVKDLEDAAGFPTSLGSGLFAGGPPAAQDSTLVDRLRAAGCVVVGKTNTPEMGYKADTVNVPFGGTANPWDLTRSAGGSSGGSAAAIAAGMVPLCTGSDGGGSIRIPSALCGLSGLKPSLGRVPTGGPHAPTWSDLSTRGPMARTIRDVALALDCVLGPDATDLRSLPMPSESWSRSLERPAAPRRVGWAPTLGYAEVDAEVRAVCEAALAKLADQGTEVIQIDPVFAGDPAGAWIRLAMTSTLRFVERFRGTPDWDRLDPEHVVLLDAFGASTSALQLLEDMDECHHLNVRLVELFHQVPVICTPTVAGQTGPIGGQGTVEGKPTPYWVSMTYPFNLTRSPAGTVCAGFTGDGLPVGLQVVGPQHGDVAVLRALAMLEDVLALDPVAPI